MSFIDKEGKRYKERWQPTLPREGRSTIGAKALDARILMVFSEQKKILRERGFQRGKKKKGPAATYSPAE